MADSDLMLSVLKAVLRERGITYRAIAGRLNVSEITIKRIFSGRSPTLETLEALCKEAGSSLFEIAERAKRAGVDQTYQLTLAQEEAITSEIKLYFFTWLLVSRVPVSSIKRRFKLTQPVVERFLLKLDRIRLIELGTAGKFEILVPRRLAWNVDGPVERLIIRKSEAKFLLGKFNRTLDYRRYFIVKGNAESIARYRGRFRQLADEMFHDLIVNESTTGDSKSFGLLVALGEVDFSVRKAIEG